MLYPLSHYDCTKIVKPEPADNGNCRHGYGKPIVAHWGASCAYCGKDMASSYDAWLSLSVDHVVPVCALKDCGPNRDRWIESLANRVPCCRACNEFLNGYRVDADRAAEVVDDSSFLTLRSAVLSEKRERALARHQTERAAYERWLSQPQNAGQS